MAGFIELSEAAKLLGISADELNQLREDGKVRAYRDGSSWKFRADEIEGLAKDRGVELSDRAEQLVQADSASFSDEDLDQLIDVGSPSEDYDSDDEVDASSILVSEDGSGKQEGSPSSTVIGKEKGAAESVDAASASDLKLADEGGSDLVVAPDESVSDSNVFSGSDLRLSEDESSSLTGELPASESELLLDSDTLGSDLELQSESDLALGDDDDMVLGGSGVGSDLTLSSDDSGINLGTPSDSGLSLEEEPEEITSPSSSALELPEDDEMISLEEMADADDPTQLQQDEEFLLSPSDSVIADEASSDDSGSQVIALEDSEAFDEEAATMVAAGVEPAMLSADAADDAGLEAQLEGGFEGAAVPAGMAAALAPAELPETPYSIWNVLGLLLIVLVLSVSGMLMVDVIRNMWTWNGGAASTTTSLMESILGALGLD